MEVDIIGIGATQASYTEYSSAQMLQQYTQAITPLKTVFSKDPSQLTAADYDTILTQIATLSQLAKNGVTDTNGTTNFQSYFTEDMVSNLNDIMRTLAVVNIPPPAGSAPLSNTDKVSTVSAWQGLQQFNIDVSGTLDSALKLESQAYNYTVTVAQAGGGDTTLNVTGLPGRTLQSLLQIEYMGLGNSLMAGHMSSLQSALTISQQALASLTAVQNISNQLNVTTRPNFTWTQDSNLDQDVKNYKAAASAFFIQIFPTPQPVASAATQLIKIKKDMLQEIASLEAANSSANRNTAGSLANGLYTVVQDISAAFLNVASTDQAALFTAVKQWILDNQNLAVLDSGSNANQALAIQGHISAALTTATNLQESQRDDVRRYMFIFQQFYKSAANMIQLLGNIFDKITQNISKQ